MLCCLRRNVEASCHKNFTDSRRCVVRLPLSKNATCYSQMTYTPHRRKVDDTWCSMQQWSLPKPDTGSWSKIAIFATVSGFTSEYCHNVWYGKTWMVCLWLPDCKNVWRFWQHTRTWQTDRQTDTAQRHRSRLCIASRGKNRNSH